MKTDMTYARPEVRSYGAMANLTRATCSGSTYDGTYEQGGDAELCEGGGAAALS